MLGQTAPRACARAAAVVRSSGSSALRRPAIRAASTNAAALRPRTAAHTRSIAAGNSFRRALSASPRSQSLIPDAENPPPKESEPQDAAVGTQPTEITLEEYHEHADRYLEVLQARLEEKQDAGDAVEVEYSAGVLNVEIPTVGTYVLNKQPPNKQIWLSSPITGPKRFDWVVVGESMNQKADGGSGDWIYLRDGSSLTQLLRKELGVEVGIDGDIP